METKTREAFDKLARRLTPEQRRVVDAALATGDERAAYRYAQLFALNEFQSAIATDMGQVAGNDMVLVVAAAGSGKTTLVTTALADLLARKVFRPEDVYLTTFTAKAASEMRERISRMVGGEYLVGMRMGTYHSLAGRYMGMRARSAPQTQPPHKWSWDAVLDPGDNERLWKRILGKPFARKRGTLPPERQNVKPWDLRFDEKYEEVRGLPGFYGLLDPESKAEDPDVKLYLSALELVTGQGFTFHDPEGKELAAQVEKGEFSKDIPPLPEFTKAWELYTKAKENLGLWDFADVLSAYWRDGTDRAKLIVVDEGQDNNGVQLKIARMLQKNGDGRLFVVGDVRQSIYAWRGAEPEFMASASEKYGAALMELPTNYRSGQIIVDIGNAIAEGKWWNLGLKANSFRGDHGFLGEVDFIGAETLMQEADRVARDIRKRIDQGLRPNQVMLLVRTNAPGTAFEIACLKHNVPAFRLGSKHGFFDGRAVKAAMSYALLGEGVSVTFADQLEALGNVLNAPSRYIGKNLIEALQKIGTLDVVAGMTRLLNDRGTFPGGKIYERSLVGVRDLRDAVQRLRAAPWRVLDEHGMPTPSAKDRPSVIMKIMTKATEAQAQDEDAEPEVGGDPTADTDGEVVCYFMDIARNFETLSALQALREQLSREIEGLDFTEKTEEDVRRLSAKKRADYERDKAHYQQVANTKLMITTIHKSKGLEADVVYVSMSKGQFPHYRSTSDKRLAEEERLAYVAWTRAANQLIISYNLFDAQGKPTGVSPFVRTSVIPVLNRYRLQRALAAVVDRLPGWSQVAYEGGLLVESPSHRVRAHLTAEVALLAYEERALVNSLGRDVMVELVAEQDPEPSRDPEVQVQARFDGEAQAIWHGLICDPTPEALLALDTELQAVYGSDLNGPPMNPLSEKQAVVAYLDGRWRSAVVAGYAGAPLYRVRLVGQDRPVPQSQVRPGDNIDIEWEEFLAFLATQGMGAWVTLLRAQAALVLPLFREVMSEPDAPVLPETVEVPDPPVASPPPSRVRHGIDVLQLDDTDWRAYRDGKTVWFEGQNSFPSRELAEHAWEVGTTTRPTQGVHAWDLDPLDATHIEGHRENIKQKELALSDERIRLSNAKTEQERELRQVWVDQHEREIKATQKRVREHEVAVQAAGLAESASDLPLMDDDALLAALVEEPVALPTETLAPPLEPQPPHEPLTEPRERVPPTWRPTAQGEWELPDGTLIAVEITSSNDTTVVYRKVPNAKVDYTYYPTFLAARTALAIEVPTAHLYPEVRSLAGRPPDDIAMYDLQNYRIGVVRAGHGYKLTFATPWGSISTEAVSSLELAKRELLTRFGLALVERTDAPPPTPKAGGTRARRK